VQDEVVAAVFPGPAFHLSNQEVAAAELFHKLRWMPWIKDPDTGEPVSLTPEDIEQGQVAAYS